MTEQHVACARTGALRRDCTKDHRRQPQRAPDRCILVRILRATVPWDDTAHRCVRVVWPWFRYFTLTGPVARGGQRNSFTIIICLIWVLATVSFGMAWADAYAVYVTYGATRDSMLGYIMGFGPEAGRWMGRRLAINYGLRLTVALNAMLAELINFREGLIVTVAWSQFHHRYGDAGCSGIASGLLLGFRCWVSSLASVCLC